MQNFIAKFVNVIFQNILQKYKTKQNYTHVNSTKFMKIFYTPIQNYTLLQKTIQLDATHIFFETIKNVVQIIAEVFCWVIL